MEIKEIIYLTVYLIGYVWAYILFKRDRINDNWNGIFFTIAFSFYSWFAVIIYYLEKIKLPKPPKWL